MTAHNISANAETCKYFGNLPTSFRNARLSRRTEAVKADGAKPRWIARTVTSVLNAHRQAKTTNIQDPISEIRYDNLYEEGLILVRDHLLCIMDTLFEIELI